MPSSIRSRHLELSHSYAGFLLIFLSFRGGCGSGGRAASPFTCRGDGSDILQDSEEHAAAQSFVPWPEAALWGQVEDSVGLKQSGDQKLHQAAHLGLDPST